MIKFPMKTDSLNKVGQERFSFTKNILVSSISYLIVGLILLLFTSHVSNEVNELRSETKDSIESINKEMKKL